MPKASPIQTSFNAGEFSPLMYGRVDYDRYKNGLELCENWVPIIQGPLLKRPGTKFIAHLADSTKKSSLIHFSFNADQSYMIEFSDQKIRFYTDDAAIVEADVTITGATQANPVVVTATAHGYANGDAVYIKDVVGMTELNGRPFVVANVTANTFELSGVDGTGYTAYTSGGAANRVYEIDSPYLEADLPEIQHAQSADVLYLTHEDYAPRKLIRMADLTWELQIIDLDDGPYLQTNPVDENVITPNKTSNKSITGATQANPVVITSASHGFLNGEAVHINQVVGMEELNDGIFTVANKATNSFELLGIDGTAYGAYVSGGIASSVTLTAANPTFAATDVERTLRFLDSAGNWSWFEIIAYTSSTVVTAALLGPDLATTTGTNNWRLGAWSDTTGYPGSVTFFEDRLWFGGGAGEPARIDGSKTSEYEVFSPSNEAGVVPANYAVSATLNADSINAIRWMSDNEKGLVVGTSGGEWIVRPSTLSESISPSNISAKRSTTFGSKKEQPIRVGSNTLFIQRSGRKLRELAYSFEKDGFTAPDLTLLSEHLSETGLVQLAFAQQPQPIVWALRADGKLLGMSYAREENVVGWHKHTLGGTDVEVESISVIPSETLNADQLWMIVKRTINGATARCVEVMTPFWKEGDTLSDSFFVDSGLQSTFASPVTTVSNLHHLEGETVSVLADGATHPDKIVVNGSITLDREATVVTVGLEYSATGRTLRAEAGAADGTAQGKTKRIHRVTFRLRDTLGWKYGRTLDDLFELPFRSAGDDMDEPPPLFTGDKTLDWPGGYDQEGYVAFSHDQPLPATLISIMPQLITQDR